MAIDVLRPRSASRSLSQQDARPIVSFPSPPRGQGSVQCLPSYNLAFTPFSERKIDLLGAAAHYRPPAGRPRADRLLREFRHVLHSMIWYRSLASTADQLT
jgi:hypothetical protein